jgi:hypothetical protein
MICYRGRGRKRKIRRGVVRGANVIADATAITAKGWI